MYPRYAPYVNVLSQNKQKIQISLQKAEKQNNSIMWQVLKTEENYETKFNLAPLVSKMEVINQVP